MIKFLSPVGAIAVPIIWYHYDIPAQIIFWASLALLLYYLFGAPTVCGVVHADGKDTCDDNAYGVLRACWREAHKRKKRQQMWRRLLHPLGGGPTQKRPTTQANRPTPAGAAHFAYSQSSQATQVGIENVLAFAEVTISTVALVVSFVAWRFPVT
jgi:hypothetical protein